MSRTVSGSLWKNIYMGPQHRYLFNIFFKMEKSKLYLIYNVFFKIIKMLHFDGLFANCLIPPQKNVLKKETFF